MACCSGRACEAAYKCTVTTQTPGNRDEESSEVDTKPLYRYQKTESTHEGEFKRLSDGYSSSGSHYGNSATGLSRQRCNMRKQPVSGHRRLFTHCRITKQTTRVWLLKFCAGDENKKVPFMSLSCKLADCRHFKIWNLDPSWKPPVWFIQSRLKYAL